MVSTDPISSHEPTTVWNYFNATMRWRPQRHKNRFNPHLCAIHHTLYAERPSTKTQRLRVPAYLAPTSITTKQKGPWSKPNSLHSENEVQYKLYPHLAIPFQTKANAYTSTSPNKAIQKSRTDDTRHLLPLSATIHTAKGVESTTKPHHINEYYCSLPM